MKRRSSPAHSVCSPRRRSVPPRGPGCSSRCTARRRRSRAATWRTPSGRFPPRPCCCVMACGFRRRPLPWTTRLRPPSTPVRARVISPCRANRGSGRRKWAPASRNSFWPRRSRGFRERQLRQAGAMPQTFGTITVSDGISMGTEGMRYSLVSREVIADSIETACGAQRMDGLLAIGGCDKNMPGAMIAIARLDIPAIFVYGGTIKPGHYAGRDLTVVSVFEAVGAAGAGRMQQDELLEIERRACPGAGSCGGMFTANTMSAAIEAMGMSLTRSSTMSAVDQETADSAARSADVLFEAVRARRLPRQILTKKAFENAIAVVMAIGGSTNAVLHLLAIARAAGVPLTLDDFETVRKRVPVLCDLKPSGRYVTTDLHRAGGIPQVMRILLTNGVLHGDALTIDGRAVADVVQDVPAGPSPDQDVIHPWDRPLARRARRHV